MDLNAMAKSGDTRGGKKKGAAEASFFSQEGNGPASLLGPELSTQAQVLNFGDGSRQAPQPF